MLLTVAFVAHELQSQVQYFIGIKSQHVVVVIVVAGVAEVVSKENSFCGRKISHQGQFVGERRFDVSSLWSPSKYVT